MNRPVAAPPDHVISLVFGTTRTADGSSPFPQARVVALTARAGRAILGQAGTGEQTLLARLVRRRPELSSGLVVCLTATSPAAAALRGGHAAARAQRRRNGAMVTADEESFTASVRAP